MPDERYQETKLTHIGGSLGSIDQRIELGVEMYSPSAVNDSSVDVRTKVNFTDVVILQDCFVTRIGGVVSCEVVYRTTCEIHRVLVVRALGGRTSSAM